jgi:hypothetical protein
MIYPDFTLTFNPSHLEGEGNIEGRYHWLQHDRKSIGVEGEESKADFVGVIQELPLWRGGKIFDYPWSIALTRGAICLLANTPFLRVFTNLGSISGLTNSSLLSYFFMISSILFLNMLLQLNIEGTRKPLYSSGLIITKVLAGQYLLISLTFTI